MARSVRLAHLAKRFFTSLRPGGPSLADESWAEGHLTGGERDLWRRMSDPDRRHAVAVARDVVTALGANATRPVVAAALLHDVGKVDAAFGTFARAAVTGIAEIVGRDRVLDRGDQTRAARYLRHDEIGAALLEAAGADPLTVTWAREHHLPAERWELPGHIGAALKAADDD